MHEEYLLEQNLHSQIKKYGYFEYDINEQLPISLTEETILKKAKNLLLITENNISDIPLTLDFKTLHIFLDSSRKLQVRLLLNIKISMKTCV